MQRHNSSSWGTGAGAVQYPLEWILCVNYKYATWFICCIFWRIRLNMVDFGELGDVGISMHPKFAKLWKQWHTKSQKCDEKLYVMYEWNIMKSYEQGLFQFILLYDLMHFLSTGLCKHALHLFAMWILPFICKCVKLLGKMFAFPNCEVALIRPLISNIEDKKALCTCRQLLLLACLQTYTRQLYMTCL